MHKVVRLLRFIDNANEWVGRVVSFFVLAIMGVVIYEVAMRYLLVKSQLWVPETSSFLFGALFVLGGGYVFLHGSHVRLDAIYARFSTKVKAILDLITAIFFFLFCGVLIWKGWLMGWDSLISLERSASAFAPPLFPIKLVIPIGAGLLLLQGLAKFIRDLSIVTAGSRVEH